MRRRDFIAGIGGAVAMPPLTRAQQPAIPTIGYLTFFTRTNEVAAGFREALNQAGYTEGRNMRIEVHAADRQSTRLHELAANLVRNRVTVIVALDGASIDAAKAATSTIPIVFNTNLDPIKFGLVASLNRPGGNLTGMTLMTSEIVGKQLQLLHEIVPAATAFGYLSDPQTRTAEELTNDIVAASRALGAEFFVAEARSRNDIETVFATLLQRGTGALVVGPYLVFATNRNRILELVTSNRIPAMYPHPSWVRRGGLMSYSANIADLNKVTADYVVRILKGANPANLPVQRPTAFDLAINQKTAKALDLAVPEALLVRATELID